MDCLPIHIIARFHYPCTAELDPPVRKTTFFAITIEPLSRIFEWSLLEFPPKRR